MGLIINKTSEKTITIQGTVIEMNSVYGRIEFAGRADGKTLEVSIATYASKEAYDSGAAILSTDVPMGNITIEIEPTEVQGLDTAHKYSKIAYEQQGYFVEVIL
jgi:hypothetical protein